VTGKVPRFRGVTTRLLAVWSRIGDRGATAVEYALIAALIAAVIAGVVAVLGHSVSNDFQSAVGGWLRVVIGESGRPAPRASRRLGLCHQARR